MEKKYRKAKVTSKNADRFEKILLYTIEFLNKYRTQLIVTSSVIILLVLSILVYTYIKTSNEEKAARDYDIALLTIQNITLMTNEQEKQQYFQNEVNRLQSLIHNYPKTSAAIRARLFLAKLMYHNFVSSRSDEALNIAISYYSAAFENSSKPFYKTIALLGRAQCYEQKNEMAKAFEDYQLVATRYKTEGFTPTALIGMARSKELINDVNTAIEIYKKVVTDYPDSLWAMFARGKLYFYSSQENK